jgi:general secretion pathway protein E
MAGELQRAINDLFDASTRTSAALQELEAEAGEVDRARYTRAELAAASEAPIVRLVDSIFESAVALQSSDIHFEPQERALRVRFRVDGVLLDHAEIPRAQQPSVLARLKVLSLMDITESRRPQDGRLSYDHHGRVYDIRVSSVPTVHGEKMVLRILDKSTVLMPLAKLGLLPEQQRRFETMIRQPHGMVIVVGPTGSGKSTTLYSSLNLLNDSTRNIMTLEDPVEYYVPGINQVQINPRLNLTFASGLRTFLRQDPDVILVGEIRDRETAEIAVQAALTGHLVLSTLHTNDSASSVTRLLDMGVQPFLVSSSVVAILAQRLIRKVCLDCAKKYTPSETELANAGLTPEALKGRQLYRAVGCPHCLNTGYVGRLGIHEFLPMDEDIRALVMQNVDAGTIKKAAMAKGMLTLREDGVQKALRGLTTLEEVMLITQEDIEREKTGEAAA